MADEVNPSPKIHELSRKVAKAHGLEAAAVLRGLSVKVQRSTNVRNGKKWYYDAVDTMSKGRWPYIPGSTLHDVLARLERAHLIEKGRFNRASYDRTIWYTMPREAIDAAAEDLIWFDFEIAKKYGIAAGILIHHIRFHTDEKRASGKVAQLGHRISPTSLSKVLPVSVSTIKRKLSQLKEAGEIEENPLAPGRWRIKKRCFSTSSESDKTGSEPDKTRSNPDERRSESDNYTHYETIKESHLESPFKKPPPTATAVCQNTLASEGISDTSIVSLGEDQSGLQYSKTWDELLLRVHEHADLFAILNVDKQKITLELATTLGLLSSGQISDEHLYELINSEDRDELVHKCSAYLGLVDTKPLEKLSSDSSKQFLMDLAQLYLVGGIYNVRRSQLGERLSSPIIEAQRYIYQITLECSKRNSDYCDTVRSDKLKLRSEILASKDKEEEADASLPPADKARIFRNAINERNDIGGDYWNGDFRTHFLTVGQHAMKKAERIFASNVECTPRDLTNILDRCIKLYLEEQPPNHYEKDPKYYARKATGIDFFLRHIEKICAELDLPCPVVVDFASDNKK